MHRMRYIAPFLAVLALVLPFALAASWFYSLL